VTRWTPLLVLLVLAGCQRAAPYDPSPRKEGDAVAKEKKERRRRPDPGVNWLDLGREPESDKMPGRIVFVHQADVKGEWAKLKAFWNDQPDGSVRIKVPLGLDDPTGHVPPGFSLTRARWELGRRLFFDDALLGTKQSCASCHVPEQGFADGKTTQGLKTPSLVNSVFLRSIFWDGRATYLEEAMQATLEDEGRPVDPFRHAWPGVIKRLRADKGYLDAFEKAFGVRPTQDTAGRALAVYMRTLLSGGSLHDRAERANPGGRPDYEAALDAAALAALGRGKSTKPEVARELVVGRGLFRGKAKCTVCHPAGNGYFSDRRYHNIDVDADQIDIDDLDPQAPPSARARRGRFNVAPLGEKTRWTLGAWKTPTLRGLGRAGPYFHNGQARTLEEAVAHHVRRREAREAPENQYLSPILATPTGNFIDFGLTQADIDAITLFVRALDGGLPDASVRTPPPK
jgi:cytochrome c peroxidase